MDTSNNDVQKLIELFENDVKTSPCDETIGDNKETNTNKKSIKTRLVNLIIYFVIVVTSSIAMIFLNVFLDAFINYTFKASSIIISFMLLKHLYSKFLSDNKNKLFIALQKLYSKISNPIKKCIVISLTIATVLTLFPKVSTWASTKIKNINSYISECFDNVDSDESSVVQTYKPDDNEDNVSKYVNFVITNDEIDEKLIMNVSNMLYTVLEGNEQGEVVNKLHSMFGKKAQNMDSYPDSWYQIYEDQFLVSVNKSKSIYSNYGICNEWKDSLVNESDLLQVINSQQSFANLYPSFEVYNKISNNYQRLAKEYVIQNGNISAIKYYYLLSAYYDVQAVSYATSKDEYNMSLCRIYYRFSDILYCNCNLTYYEYEKINYLLNELESFSVYE